MASDAEGNGIIYFASLFEKAAHLLQVTCVCTTVNITKL